MYAETEIALSDRGFSTPGTTDILDRIILYDAGCPMHPGMFSSLDILLSQSGNSPLFHVWFQLLILDLHTGFSGGR